MEKKLYKLAVLLCVLGFLALAVVLLSGTAYPEMLFRVLAPVGLLLIVAALVLYACAWILSIKKAVKSKDCLWLGLLILVGILVIVEIVLHRR